MTSKSWRRDNNGADDNSVPMTRNPSFGDGAVGASSSSSGAVGASSASGANLDGFFEDVEGIQDELKEVERLHRSLHDSNESGKTLHTASAVRALRAQMDSDVALALKKAKLIKLRLESLDRANAENCSVPGCGPARPGTATDRTRTSVVSGLRENLKNHIDNNFSQLMKDMRFDYKEAVARRYYIVTGEKPDEDIVDRLVETGEGERFLKTAIEEDGRGNVVDVIAGIQERHVAARELEKSLLELQHLFMDVSVLVTVQGEQLDDIESQVGRAESFVQRGTAQLQVARRRQKSTRKWSCIGIGIGILTFIVIIILIRVLIIIVKKNRS